MKVCLFVIFIWISTDVLKCVRANVCVYACVVRVCVIAVCVCVRESECARAHAYL